MNVIKSLYQFRPQDIYFCEPIANNIMDDGVFIRIIDSSPFCIINGLYLHMQLSQVTYDKHFNKFKCNFYIGDHIDMINRIKIIEECVLQKAPIAPHKTPQLKIHEQLCQGHIKLFTEEIDPKNNQFVLKISGLWETSDAYGLTYKFIPV